MTREAQVATRGKGPGSEEVRWGLIGTTGWAEHTFAPAIVAGGARLVGAAGSSPEGSETFANRHSSAKAFNDVDELLDADDVDVIWVASPSHLHRTHALRALDAGKHVLVEKPMCTTMSDACTMVDEARHHEGLVTAVGFQHRFNPAHRRLVQMCSEGVLGHLALVHLRFLAGAEDLPTNWRRDPHQSGGWAVNDLGTHLLDLYLQFVGQAGFAGAVYCAPRFSLPVDDLAVLVLRSEDAAGVIEVSTGVAGGVSAIDIYGTEDHASLRDSWPGGGTLVTRKVESSFEPVNTYARQVEALSAAVRGRAPWEGANWTDGLRVTELVTQGLSATHGSTEL